MPNDRRRLLFTPTQQTGIRKDLRRLRVNKGIVQASFTKWYGGGDPIGVWEELCFAVFRVTQHRVEEWAARGDGLVRA